MDKDTDTIYYASGESIDKIDMLPQVEAIKDKGFPILYLTEYVDEFVIKTLGEYNKKKFVNVSSKDVDLNSEEEKRKNLIKKTLNIKICLVL